MATKKNELKMFTRDDLINAAEKVGYTNQQVEKLWNLLSDNRSKKWKFNIFNTIYFLGGLVIFFALVWVLKESYSLYGKKVLFLISSGYSSIFYALGAYLWKIKEKNVIGRIFLFLSLSLVPLATYAFQDMLGWWPGDYPGSYDSFYKLITSGWLLIEIITIVCTLVTLYFFRSPFLTSILYLTMLFMSEDIAPFFFDFFSKDIQLDSLHSVISVFFGLCIISLSFILDLKKRRDFAFWGYLFGTIAFWFGITFINYNTELGHSIYCLLNIVLLFAGGFVGRKVFTIFGVLGIMTYLYELFHRYFSTSLAFPLIVSCIGITVIFIGIYFQNHKKQKTYFPIDEK